MLLKNRIKRTIFLSIVMLVILVSSACSGSSSTTQSDDSPPESNDSSDNIATDIAAGSGGTVVIGMTAANIPTLDIVPTEGFEGYRFVGFQLYDGLTRWDLTQGDSLPEIGPGLAASWEISAEDDKTWIFYLQQNATFHDGTKWDADAAIHGLDRILNENAPHYDPRLGVGSLQYSKEIASYEKIDDYTISISTNDTYAYLPYDLTMIFFASPTAVEENGENYMQHPIGTGPFKFSSMVDGDQLVLEPNMDYWGAVPKAERLIVKPMPDASARLAAFLAGEINWIEVPSYEAVPRLEGEGNHIFTNEYPHIWPIHLNHKNGPWTNKLVRQAANFAIDREGLVNGILNGFGAPATQPVIPGHDWYNEDVIEYNYDPERAKQLLAEAGYPDGFKTKFIVPTSGSGNMRPLQMNEYIQQNLRDIGIEVELEAIEWQTLRSMRVETGFPDDGSIGGYNWSAANHQIPTQIENYHTEIGFPPNALNVGFYDNSEATGLLRQARKSMDIDEQNRLIREAIGIITEDAQYIFVAHDVNLRAMAPNVKGFVQPKSWFADLTTIYVE